jgi:hypothetical protein
MAQRQIPQYYVYEHWRLDKDECFYVGKGHGDRAYETYRTNDHWNNIVSKLERIGSGYEVRLVVTGLTEKEAFRLERERIAFWRDIVDLSNKTDGGEGPSGMKHTAEAKAKMSLGRIGNQNAKGMRHTEELKAKRRKRFLSNNPMKNPEVAKKTADALRSMGPNHPSRGEESRRKRSISQKGKCAGEKNAAAKLTAEQVIEIRNSDEKSGILAKKYGIHRGTVFSIKAGKSWKSVPIKKELQEV